MKLSVEDHRVAEGHESTREAPSGEGSRDGKGCPRPQGWGSGVSPPGKFWNLRRNLVQSGAFGKKLTFHQLSTLVNENTVIVLHSGVDIVTYYFNF